MTLVPLDPTQADAMTEMPGPLVAVRADESAAELEPVMMAEISAWQGGQRLQLAPGKTVRLTFAVPAGLQTSVSEGQQIPAWWYDDVQGRWREEGNGKIERENGDLVWVVEVAHFTWWNCDKPWTEKNCYAVTVLTPKGHPVKNMKVTASGVDYQGTMSGYTQGDGQACVEGKLGGKVVLEAGLWPNILADAKTQGNAEQPAACGGPGTCVPVVLMLDAECFPGEQETCYPGPANTEGVGICKAGVKTTLGDCAWSACAGAQLPLAENCSSKAVDEDCDGLPVNGCVCSPGAVEACFHPNPDISSKQDLKMGVCHGGTRTCAADGKSWGICEGMEPPLSVPKLAKIEGLDKAACTDILDNNCNGAVNEGCECDDGVKADCYGGNDGDVGICKKGESTCVGGDWGPCEGQVLPKVEQCDTPADEDCDGNSGCCGDGVVAPGAEREAAFYKKMANDIIFESPQLEQLVVAQTRESPCRARAARRRSAARMGHRHLAPGRVLAALLGRQA